MPTILLSWELPSQHMARILVVDDETTLLATLRFNLEREGYEVITATGGGDALELAERERPDLVLLDLMLPGMHGFEVCRALRKHTSIPIVILTARTEEVDRVVGLELGADDYITKPFSMVELVARVRACLRRAAEFRAADESHLLSSDALSVDLGKREAALRGIPLDLKTKEFDLLVTLMQNRGQTLTRDQLFLRVWRYESLGSSRTVDVHIGRLRRKIEDDSDRPVRIVTVRGAGYRFEG
jgi:DNA-binding response OmpR family regulator